MVVLSHVVSDQKTPRLFGSRVKESRQNGNFVEVKEGITSGCMISARHSTEAAEKERWAFYFKAYKPTPQPMGGKDLTSS
jgi:hypothetical protein